MIAPADLQDALARHQRWLDTYARDEVQLQPDRLPMGKAGLR
jgi:hypothetical protein